MADLEERLRAYGVWKRLAEESGPYAAAARNVYQVRALAFDWDEAADHISAQTQTISDLTRALERIADLGPGPEAPDGQDQTVADRATAFKFDAAFSIARAALSSARP